MSLNEAFKSRMSLSTLACSSRKIWSTSSMRSTSSCGWKRHKGSHTAGQRSGFVVYGSWLSHCNCEVHGEENAARWGRYTAHALGSRHANPSMQYQGCIRHTAALIRMRRQPRLYESVHDGIQF